MVAAALFLMSSSRSLFVASSALGGLPLPSWGKGFSVIGESVVAFDRKEADAKESGGLGPGHTALVDGLDYLSSEVFG